MKGDMIKCKKKKGFPLGYPESHPCPLDRNMIFHYLKPMEKADSVFGVTPACHLSQQHCEKLKNQYVKKIATDLSFSEEVKWERGLPYMPFSQYSFAHIYNTDGIMARRETRKDRAGKPVHTRAEHTRAEHTRALRTSAGNTTYLTETEWSAASKKKQKKPKPKGPDQKASSPPRPRFVRVKSDMLDLSPSPDENLEERETWLPPGEKEARGWEAIVLEKLDKRTARWIQNKRPLRPGQSPNKWQAFLRQQYDWSHIREGLTAESDLELLRQLEAEEIAEFEDESMVPTPVEIKKPELLLPVYYR